jgi:eukaryotic-like serine/threonine-protein kinase
MTETKPSGTRVAMTGERWRKIEEAFERAVELPKAERPGTLVGLDDTLRAEVEALLARADGGKEKDKLPGIVERAARMMRAPAELVGRRLGPYRLVRELGHGGMGAVYLAVRDDDQYRTEVAIKVLHRGLESSHATARFRDERQILATLEHPSIVRLLDGGASPDGVPYLVMERVQGVPITRYVRDRALAIAARVELFRKVCAAVQYAHTKLVIHRDLKPSNILVTDDGVPKLLDFGIAKLAVTTGEIKREAETRTGMVMLTPEYASPEQVRAEAVSTVSDVYSLGAVLYELVTGQPAHRFDGTGGLDTLRTILETPPQKPSVVAPEQHRKALAGDLDNIILKALDKDPERRYPSVEHLSEDLRRHLDGMPVEARAATWSYRAGKFIRRNRLAVAGVAFVAVALSTATVVSISQAARASRERARAEEKRQEAEQATATAERRFNDVRKLANTLLFDVDGRIATLAGSTKARELIVRNALDYLDGLSKEASGNVALQRELAVAYMKIGDIQGNRMAPNLGHAEDALLSYDKAAQIIDYLAASEGDRESLKALEVQLLAGKGQLHRQRDDKKAKEELGAAIALAASLQPTPELQQHVVQSESGLVELHLDAHDGNAAEAHANRCLQAAHAWSRLTASSASSRYYVGVAHELKAQAAALLGDPDNAVKQLELARTLFVDLSQHHPEDARYRRELRWVLTLVATYRAGIGSGDVWIPNLDDREGARTALREAIALHLAAVDADPADMRGRLDLAVSYIQLGAISSDLEALESFGRARKLHDQLNERYRDDPYTQGVAWFLDCAMAAPLARTGQRSVALTVLERGHRSSATASYPLADMMCEHLLAPARRALEGDESALAGLQRNAIRLRAKIAESPGDLILRIGLIETLRLQTAVTPRPQQCSLAREALETWKAWAGTPTPYTVRIGTTLEANAHACEANLRERR